jgi:hypothetical protein
MSSGRRPRSGSRPRPARSWPPGYQVSGRDGLLRAATYWRSAEFFTRDRDPDPRGRPTYEAGVCCFADAAALMSPAVTPVTIPWHASYDYYNFEETPAPASTVLPPASYHRLQAIKAAYDPDQVIISAYPAWPARP